MSNGTISLEAAIRTCKVDTAYSNKVQSDRFLNPNLMVCPVWSGVDTTGREVCPDSYYTKNAGCNSAEDRVYVENNLRPQYMEYINLSAQGIDAAIYGNTMPWNEVGQSNAELQAVNNVTGNFGKQFGASVYPGCNYYPYEEAMTQEQAALQGVASNTSPVSAQGVYQPGVGNQQQLLTQQFHGPGASNAAPNMARAGQMQGGHMNTMEGFHGYGMAGSSVQPGMARQMKRGNAMPNRGIGMSRQNAMHNQGKVNTMEGFQNLARNPVNNANSQQFAANQQQFRNQGVLNNAFQQNYFRRSGGN